MSRFQNLAIKDHLREAFTYQYRAIVMIVIMAVVFLILVGRLFYLQIIDHDHYITLSDDNRVSIVPIPPPRGLIYDRNGVVLAQNVPTFSLEIVPEHVDDLEETLSILRSLVSLSDADISTFRKNLKQKRRFEGITLRSRLNNDEVDKIAVNQHRLPGVDINAELTRHYPLGNLASHAIGYVGRISEKELKHLDISRYSATRHIGKVGIEKRYEDILLGEVGYQRVETNAQGRILHILERTELNEQGETVHVLERTLPIPGQDLFLTLDARVQAVAENAFGEEKGALVAINPKNGEILALASMPTFDPNIFVHGLDVKTFRKLTNSPDKPLYNRAIKGLYPPGSTVKPFIGLGGLELDTISPHMSLNCPGWYMLKNDERRYRDWKKEGHGQTKLDKAIIQSCDVFFYDLSLGMTIDKIHQYLSFFGFGKKTGVDLVGEANGLLPSREWKKKKHGVFWFPGETLITGIGQGYTLATPIQLASSTATLSRFGEGFRPRMLYAIQEPGSEAVSLKKPIPLSAVPKARTGNWNYVLNAMTNVVHGLRGTARGIGLTAKYKIAGKTGTAQVFGIKQDEEYDETKVRKKLRDHALFIGFAPADDPQIAVAVIVENGGHGSTAAAPIVRKVMDAYLISEQ